LLKSFDNLVELCYHNSVLKLYTKGILAYRYGEAGSNQSNEGRVQLRDFADGEHRRNTLYMFNESSICKLRTVIMRVFLLATLLSASLHMGCGLTISGEKSSVSVEEKPQALVVDEQKRAEDTPQSALKSLLPDNDLIEGWQMTDAPVFYDEDNLFEYIDGKAEEYRSYDFYMLISAQYSVSGSEDEIVTVDIYDMGAEANAFGIYSVQRYPEADYVEIGGQGFFTEASLEFWKGRYFMKLSTAAPSEALRDVMTQFGQHISSKIEGESKPPVILSYLPEKGYVSNSAVYALRDIMGQSFLKNGIVAEYTIDGTTSRLFLTQYASSEEALEAFNSYSKFLKESGGEIEALSGIGEGALAAEVSFYGRVAAFHQGVFMGGILGASEGSGTTDLLGDVLSNLKSVSIEAAGGS
jgi:hypothetical protein